MKKETLKRVALAVLLLIALTLTITSALADVDGLVFYRKPSITVNDETRTVSAIFYLENPEGTGEMPEFSLIELQILDTEGEFLSMVTVISPQKTCDPSHPENVHRNYAIGEGDRFEIPLETSQLEDGRYQVVCVTANGCYAEKGEDFRFEGPCGSGKKVKTVFIGKGLGGGPVVWGIGMIIIGVVLMILGLIPHGLIIAIIGFIVEILFLSGVIA